MAAPSAAAIPPPAPPSPPLAHPRPLGSSLVEAEALACLLRSQVEQANLDPVEVAPWATRASLASSYRAALNQVSVLRGEGELSESSLSRHVVFRRFLDAVLEVLAKHPAALRAVLDRIAEMVG